MPNVIINLISYALFNKGNIIAEDVNWEELYLFAKKQQISVLIYYGLLNSKISVPSDVLKRFENDVFINMSVSYNQVFEAKGIAEAFEKNGIDYMLLKGTILKEIYPKPEMRQMSDADILIRTEQAEKTAEVMTGLGYTYKYDSDHEIVWSKAGKISIELHKRLIPSYNKDFYEYYGDGWKRAKSIDGKSYGYELSPEDNYTYVFTHFAKHYRDAGVGLKHMVDLYLLQKHIMDIGYVEEELKKLQLFNFYCNVMRTLKVWFDSAVTDAQTTTITNRVFAGGAYGTAEAHVLSSAVKSTKTTGSAKSTISKKVITMLFPSKSVLEEKYTILSKAPFLLPFIWFWRWITAILFRRNNIKIQANTAKVLSEDKINSYQSELNFVGLDFNFKE